MTIHKWIINKLFAPSSIKIPKSKSEFERSMEWWSNDRSLSTESLRPLKELLEKNMTDYEKFEFNMKLNMIHICRY